MDAFEYLSVLISIILGLGIAQLLAGFGHWISQRAGIRPFAPAIVWAGILLLMHVQTWWSMFGLRLLAGWTFVRFSVVLLQPITLYLMAIVVLPNQGVATVDMRTNYFGQRRWFFGLLGFLLVVSVVKDLVVSGSLPSGLNLGFHTTLLIATIVALSTERTAVHGAVAIVSSIAMIAYVGLLFGNLR